MKIKNSDSGAGREKLQLHIFGSLSSIHKALASKTYPTTAELAGQLEVSARTVRRYIEFMRDRFNAPISFDRARNGFYYTHPNWQLPLVPLTEGELLAFFIATIALQGKGATYEEKTLRRALGKIAVSLPDEISVNLGYLFDHTSFQSPPHVIAEMETLDRLRRCVAVREAVEFDYTSPNSGTSRRLAHPLHLFNHEGTWYAVCFDPEKKDFRNFHLARISNLKAKATYFEPPKNWDKERHLEKGFGMYSGGSETGVEIIFDKYQAQWMRERTKFHPGETREELADGSLKLTFTVGENALEAVARFCLTYAGNFIAVKPEKLREIIKKKLRHALRQHE
ncbi:MAG: WYL domain-containing transcriptional regulator [Pyrinomonadaceae bacterium]|nr:WYL domain-containing transcriptional regulator [Pyrinomonadaceae bacterium]